MEDFVVPAGYAHLRFLKCSEYLSLPRNPIPWAIKKLIPSSGLLSLYGKPKAGKSFAAIGMAMAIADERCTHWLDPSFVVNTHGPVMYLQEDTPREIWTERIEDILRVKQYKSDNLWLADTLSSPYPFDILDRGCCAWLKAAVAEVKPAVVFLDTLREIHAGDEDNSTVMRNVISRLVEATRPAACVFVAHTRKANMKGAEDDIMEGARGSSYVAGRMDVVARLTMSKFSLKGRASGNEEFAILQDPGTGLIVIDHDANNREVEEVIKSMTTIPDVSQNDLRKTLLLMYPEMAPEKLRSKWRRMKDKVFPKGGNPKKMGVTHEQIHHMTLNVKKGKHPLTGKPLPEKLQQVSDNDIDPDD
jgi:hypothetical protein